ncbi:hypothetical protein ACSMXN_09350 [Jatrophihabitans sp. DSM 45814]
MPELTTRSEHIRWCKERALAELDQGNVQNAFASLVSDLGKHGATRDHAAFELGAMLQLGGFLSTPREMREFIEGLESGD